MARIAIVGAGLSGVAVAYDIKALVGNEHQVTLISDSDTFHFVPSNPWVAVNWREPEDIQVKLEPHLSKKKIEFIPIGLKQLIPDESRMVLVDGQEVKYDYLVIATGPRLAFDEITGLGPHNGFTHSICHVDHAREAAKAWDRFVAAPGPIVVGAAQLASCFGPAYEYAFIVDTELRKRGVRDQVPITFVTPEPYIGHLGLGGVGDSKGMMESALRERHIKWITNAKIDSVEEKMMHVIEHDSDGNEKKRHELPFDYSMVLPAFTGIAPFMELEGLVNPRGFILIDKHQRNPTFTNIYAIGVCVAIPPVEPTPIPTGAPKTGFMIESMAVCTAKNIHAELTGKEPNYEATWNAICLADMGDTGIAFVAMPQIPPRNVTWAKSGKWVHYAKVALEKYFLYKVRAGTTEPYIERTLLKTLGILKLKNEKK
ncbi:MAG: NAD(P)/FAD-dependent oxidoreductase [Candidatus Polarisedimenticolaceae bacterium]|nr:NAD(P)/FAD-dependent oxidoreductase [Candidatus Polarisedimenticolaceae bacterium]